MLSKALCSPMKELLGFVMRCGTNAEKNTKLEEGLRWLAKESHGIRKKKLGIYLQMKRLFQYWPGLPQCCIMYIYILVALRYWEYEGLMEKVRTHDFQFLGLRFGTQFWLDQDHHQTIYYLSRRKLELPCSSSRLWFPCQMGVSYKCPILLLLPIELKK